MLQYLGIAASLISICKGTSDWWARSKTIDLDEEPTFVETIKAALFFTPHVIFRAFALTMCAGFLGYYVIGPITLVIIIVLCNVVQLFKKAKEEDNEDFLSLTFFLTILAPITFLSELSTQRTLMKRTITTTTSILLTTLTIIRLLPLIILPETLVATYGLRHLNFLPSNAGALAI